MIKFLRVGKIVKPQGIKGEVKVLATTSDLDKFKNLKSIILQIDEEAKDEDIEKAKDIKSITGVKYLKDFVILKLENIDKVEDAEKLRNLSIYIKREDSGDLKTNEYFVADLKELTVVDYDNDKEIGIVADILETKNQNILVVKKDKNAKKEILIPLVDEFIKKIDLDNKRIIVSLLSGMDE